MTTVEQNHETDSNSSLFDQILKSSRLTEIQVVKGQTLRSFLHETSQFHKEILMAVARPEQPSGAWREVHQFLAYRPMQSADGSVIVNVTDLPPNPTATDL